MKVTSQQVGCRLLRCICLGGVLVATPRPRQQATACHQARHPFASVSSSVLAQRLRHAWTAIRSMAVLEDALDFIPQGFILLYASGRAVTAPHVVTARRYLQHTTQCSHGYSATWLAIKSYFTVTVAQSTWRLFLKCPAPFPARARGAAALQVLHPAACRILGMEHAHSGAWQTHAAILTAYWR